jgi:hypothetical protein
MSVFVPSLPVWKQLGLVWGAAIALASFLLLLDRVVNGPWQFFWLIPYPTLEVLPAYAAASVDFFRLRPLVATALLAIPLSALITTFALVARRVIHVLFHVGST